MTPLPKKLIKGKRFNLRECEIQIGIELITADLGLAKDIKSISNFHVYFRRSDADDKL